MTADDPRRVLLVCTANVCRSYMAQVAMTDRAHALGLDLAISSAGTRLTDHDVQAETITALADAGFATNGLHRPRPMTPAIVRDDGSDLVITMTRQHLREVVAMDRLAWPRSFTLREIVRRANTLRGPVDGWQSWIESLGDGRTARDLAGNDPADDIDDPFGLPLTAHRDCLRTIRALVDQFVALAPRPNT